MLIKSNVLISGVVLVVTETMVTNVLFCVCMFSFDWFAVLPVFAMFLLCSVALVDFGTNASVLQAFVLSLTALC